MSKKQSNWTNDATSSRAGRSATLERQKEWFNLLGEFKEITPYQAAETWKVPLHAAMWRLHIMLGLFVAIPIGCVEKYQNIWEEKEAKP